MGGRRRTAGTLAAALLLTACSSSDGAPATMRAVRFGVLPVIDQLPYWVMLEQGIAKRHGIRLEEVSFPGGPAVLDAMADGTVDAGYPGVFPVIAAARNGRVPGAVRPSAAVSFADASHPGQAVVVGSSTISWQDLDGAAIGVNQLGAIGEVAIRARLPEERVTQSRFVEISFPNLVLAVTGGTVTAAVLPEPFVSEAVARGAHVLGWVIGGGAPFPEFQQTMLVFRSGFVESSPELALAFVRAHLEAVRWIERHPDSARSIIGRRFALQESVRRRLSLPRFATDGRNDPALLARMQSVAAGADMSATIVRPERLYDERLLDEVLAKRLP